MAAALAVADRHRQRQMNNKSSQSDRADKKSQTPSLKNKLSGTHNGWKKGRISTSSGDTVATSMRSGSSEYNSLDRYSTNTSVSTHQSKGVTKLHFLPKPLPSTPKRSLTLPISKPTQDDVSLHELYGDRPPSAMSARSPSSRAPTIPERNSDRGLLRHWEFRYNDNPRRSNSSERTTETRGTSVCSPFSRPVHHVPDSRPSTPQNGNRIQEVEDSDPELTPRRAMKQLPAMLSSLGIHVPGGLLPDTASSIYTEVGPDDRHYNRSDYTINTEHERPQPMHPLRRKEKSWVASRSPSPERRDDLDRCNGSDRSCGLDRSNGMGHTNGIRGSTISQAQLRQDLKGVKEKLGKIGDELFELQRKKAALEAEMELWQRHRILIEEQLM